MIGWLSRAGLLVMAGIFTIAIANAAARLTWTLSGETGTQVSDITAALSAPSSASRIDLSPILALAPFGSPAAVVAAPAAAQETSLGLVLNGVVVAYPPRNSVAMIASQGGEAKVYGPGDTIDGKAVLQEINADQVVLAVAGKVEVLSFPKPGARLAGASTGFTNSGVDKLAASITNPGATTPPASASGAIQPALEEWRQKVLQNPKSLLDSFGVTPSAEGYRIQAGASPNVLRAGLRPGDLIAKVNGQTVGDIEHDRGLVDAVIASGRVRIEVVRDGRTVVMTFPLQ